MRSQYPLKVLLKKLHLPRATFYDRLHRNKKPDKYAQFKEFVAAVFYKSRETYGYRRIYLQAVKNGYHYSEETIRKIMTRMGLKVIIYSVHTSRYHSYKGLVGKVAPNILNQKFNATKPYTVFHTDVTQVRLSNGDWGYLSAVTDEASHELLAAAVGPSPNKQLISGL